METKKLGGMAVEVPVIGLGTWKYEGGAAVLRKGVQQGASLIDTAEFYGTEGTVGQSIKDDRNHVFIATKVSGNHLRYEDVIAACHRSLARLGTDFIDLYQIHWPDPSVPLSETMAAMEYLVDSGMVRFIGVSNFTLGELEKAQASMKKYRIVSNQLKYSLLYRGIEDELLPYCQENEITVIAYSPLARGDLLSRSTFRDIQSADILRKVALDVGKSQAQVALNWCISKVNTIAIPKANSMAHVEENCGAAGWRLGPDQVAALDQAFDNGDTSK
jgi:diketogulonate reductase-like aldo/keto reductase